MTHSNRVRLSKLSIGLIVALAAAPAFAQSPLIDDDGRITGADGQSVSGAQVHDRATESGSVSNASPTTRGTIRGARSARAARTRSP